MNGNTPENQNNIISNELFDEKTDAVKQDSKSKPQSTDAQDKIEIVGVKFKKQGKTYYFAPNSFTLKEDDRVIVDTSRGQEYGYIAVSNRIIKSSEISEPLRAVIRKATDEDTKIHNENVKKEIDAFNACIAMIDKHKLEMKLIDAELSFDRSKLLFYFSAEGRVDFRELVKDLAAMFHVRIEMRQIGIRDEAKILGGLGICGRPYCCNTFLSDFGQVSVKMAKEQNLSLNSAKISGACGRLMCCLRYEYDTYLKEKALTPKVNSRVVTPSGAGVVIDANPLAGIVKVRLDGNGEDSDAVVFVREDVIDESKYAGEKLTKTEIPDKSRKNDDMPTFDSFAYSKAPAEPSQKEPKTEAPSVDNNRENEVPASAGQSNNEAADAERRNFRKKRKKHHKGSHGSSENRIADNGSSQNNKQSEPSVQQHKGQNANHSQAHEKQQPKQNNANPSNGNQGKDGSQVKKKKKFRPYYKHKKNNKNRENGENK